MVKKQKMVSLRYLIQLLNLNETNPRQSNVYAKISFFENLMLKKTYGMQWMQTMFLVCIGWQVWNMNVLYVRLSD